jgi:type I restriction enzyme, R subunit
MAQFAFLQAEWPGIHEAAAKAEASARTDPRTSCFYARRTLELVVHWVYKHDTAVELPYQDNLSSLIHDPTFQQAAGTAVFQKAKYIVRYGNQAVHSPKAVHPMEAQSTLKELFHVCYWLAHTYAKGTKPPADLQFDPTKLPTGNQLPKQTVDQLLKLETQLRERDDKLSELLADKDKLDAVLLGLRAEIAEIKKANTATPDAHDYSEEETRDQFIDLMLKESGWALDQKHDREFEVEGMPNAKGKGKVDYVLWGDDGLPLALVEAKRTRKDARVGQQQAKLYADCLEAKFGRRPVIFYTNGYEHWMWDDTTYPPRPVQGFYKKDELELLIQRRTSRKTLKGAEINDKIVERYYQTRAIRRLGEAFETDKLRKGLLVMATGAGKTRTVIALVDLLTKCHWAKRVLFLADRVALVNQAANAFKAYLPDSAPVNLVTEKNTEGRVFVSTYPTMMGLIDDTRDGNRRFSVGHFDLIVIDEAHRSVFQKYRAIFD